jgi:hypothetical protein
MVVCFAPFIYGFRVLALRHRGTERGRRAAFFGGIFPFLLVGLPVLNFLAEPEPVLNWLYEATGATPGRHDVMSLKLVMIFGIFGLLGWLIGLWRKLHSEHPLSKAMRSFDTPQPGYGRAVGVPMLVLTAIYLITSLTVTFVVPQSRQTVHLLVGYSALLLPVAWLLLHLRRVATGKGTKTSPPSLDATPLGERAGRASVQGPAELLIAAAVMTLLTGVGIVAWWLGTGEFDPERVYNSSAKANLQWNMMMIAGVHLGYSLLIGSAAATMFALRIRLYALLVIIVVGLLLPTMFIINCLDAEVPEQLTLIPFWIGMPVALWATIVLFRQNVRAAFQAESLQRKREKQSDDIDESEEKKGSEEKMGSGGNSLGSGPSLR